MNWALSFFESYYHLVYLFVAAIFFFILAGSILKVSTYGGEASINLKKKRWFAVILVASLLMIFFAYLAYNSFAVNELLSLKKGG